LRQAEKGVGGRGLGSVQCNANGIRSGRAQTKKTGKKNVRENGVMSGNPVEILKLTEKGCAEQLRRGRIVWVKKNHKEDSL